MNMSSREAIVSCPPSALGLADILHLKPPNKKSSWAGVIAQEISPAKLSDRATPSISNC